MWVYLAHRCGACVVKTCSGMLLDLNPVICTGISQASQCEINPHKQPVCAIYTLCVRYISHADCLCVWILHAARFGGWVEGHGEGYWFARCMQRDCKRVLRECRQQQAYVCLEDVPETTRPRFTTNIGSVYDADSMQQAVETTV